MFIKVVLKNKLRVILAPMKNARSVTSLLLVGVGSKYEKKSQNGISHFLEHMCFKGTKKRPHSLSISKELDRVGGTFNAFTGKDYTGYFVKVIPRHLELALDIVSDIFLNSLFKEEEIEKEKRVILEEIKLIEDTPIRFIEDLFEKLLYKDQPAGWPITGKKETVLKFKRKDFLFWTKNFYKAENTVITLAGKFKPKEALKLIEKYFLMIPSGKTLKKERVKEKQKKPELLFYKKETKQAHLAIGVRAYNIFNQKKYPLSLLSTVLGGNMSSRLFQKLREKEGLAYYLSSDIETNPDTGYLVVFTGTSEENVEKAISMIIDEFLKIKKEGPEKKEMILAKRYIKGKLFLALEESQNLASFYGMQELLEKKILTPEEKLKQIEKVTLKDIQEVAQKIFDLKKLNLAIIAPKKIKMKNFF